MSFPRQQRFVLTRRVQDFQERIIEAGVSKGLLRAENLVEADMELSKLRFYLRLSRDLRWLSLGQYEHVARMVQEIGPLLGGWRKREVDQRDLDGEVTGQPAASWGQAEETPGGAWRGVQQQS